MRNRRRNITIVNNEIDYDKLAETIVKAQNNVKAPKKIVGKVLRSSSPDDFNVVGAENRVVPEERTFEVKDGCVELPAHSLVVLKF